MRISLKDEYNLFKNPPKYLMKIILVVCGVWGVTVVTLGCLFQYQRLVERRSQCLLAGGAEHLPAVALSPQDVQHGGQDCGPTHRTICSARLARQELQTL